MVVAVVVTAVIVVGLAPVDVDAISGDWLLLLRGRRGAPVVLLTVGLATLPVCIDRGDLLLVPVVLPEPFDLDAPEVLGASVLSSRMPNDKLTGYEGVSSTIGLWEFFIG